MGDKIILIMQWFFLASFAFSLAATGRPNRNAAIFGAAFFSSVLSHLLLYNTAPAMLLAGALPLGMLAFMELNPKGKSGRKAAVAALLAGVALFFFSGCGAREKTAPPSVTEEIKLDFIPGKILKPNRVRLFVCAEREKRVVIYEAAAKKAVDTIKCGNMPSDIKVKDKLVFIANAGPGSVTMHNFKTKKTETIDAGGAGTCSVIYNKEKGLIYAANTGSNNVSIIDLKTMKVKKKIPTGKWPSYLYYPPGRSLYVVCKYTNTIEIIDTEKEQHVFTQINAGMSPVKLIPLGSRIISILSEWEYYNSQTAIIFFDRKNLELVRSINVNGSIFDGLLSKSRRYFYLSDPVNERVVVVDIKSKEKNCEIKLQGDTPKWLALSPDGLRLYVACQGSKKIKVIDVSRVQ
jgi:YVTN family beta-propeller protein